LKRQPRLKRWEQPFNVRPAQRSMLSRSKRERYTNEEMAEAIDMAKFVGEAIGHELGRREVEEELGRVVEAWEDGKLTDLAREVGVMPSEEDWPDRLVDEVEAFLREQD
jgi:hypothetical protein